MADYNESINTSLTIGDAHLSINELSPLLESSLSFPILTRGSKIIYANLYNSINLDISTLNTYLIQTLHFQLSVAPTKFSYNLVIAFIERLIFQYNQNIVLQANVGIEDQLTLKDVIQLGKFFIDTFGDTLTFQTITKSYNFSNPKLAFTLINTFKTLASLHTGLKFTSDFDVSDRTAFTNGYIEHMFNSFTTYLTCSGNKILLYDLLEDIGVISVIDGSKIFVDKFVNPLTITDISNTTATYLTTIQNIFTTSSGFLINLNIVDKLTNQVSFSDITNLASLDTILKLIYFITYGETLIANSTTKTQFKATFDLTEVYRGNIEFIKTIKEKFKSGFTIILDGEIYQCWVLNTSALLPSIYTNFNFTSYITVDNMTYATKDDGIYILGAEEDVNIPIKTGIKIITDILGTQYSKRLRLASFGISGEEAVLRVTNDTGDAYTYYAIRNRVDLGKGFSGKIWTLELVNINEVTYIELYPLILSK